MARPYFGVTYKVRDGVRPLGLLTGLPENPRRLFMLGVSLSHARLAASRPRWAGSVSPLAVLRTMFPEDPRALNLIHYYTEHPEGLAEQLLEITYMNIPNLHGFQLNIPWPPPAKLACYRAGYPAMRLVLQIGGIALEDAKHSSAEIAERVSGYEGIVDDILLDPSGGLGVAFDPGIARRHLEALSARCPWVGLGAAGGLSASTIHLVAALLPEFPDLNFDAQGRLQGKKGLLDLNFSRKYVARALAACGEVLCGAH